MNEAQAEERLARAKQAMTTASIRLRAALAALEQKYNFNPNQPRRPKGTAIGGQWMDSPRGMQFGPSAEDLGRSMAGASARLDAFVREHPTEITRALGALQTIVGGFEMVGGVVLVTGGGATSEVGVGIPVAMAGAWVITMGYQNAEAGWHALLTGEHLAPPRRGHRVEIAGDSRVRTGLTNGAAQSAARPPGARPRRPPMRSSPSRQPRRDRPCSEHAVISPNSKSRPHSATAGRGRGVNSRQ